MCMKKDIDVVLGQLQQCQGHEENRKILELLTDCEACVEKSNLLVQGSIQCRCEIDKHSELFNIVEHVKQHRIFEK